MMQKCKTNTDQQQFVDGPKMASLELICYFSENFGPSLWSTLMEAITVQVFYILRKHCLLKIRINEHLVKLVPA